MIISRCLAALIMMLSLKAVASESLCKKLDRAMEFSQAELPLDPKTIHYVEYGPQHEETVVLIHGMNGSLDTWSHIAPLLAAHYRVIAYDQRAHGSTPLVGTKLSNATMARDLATLLDYLKIEKVSIIGHSMGGRTGMKFAQLYPDRVHRLIVEDMHIDGKDVDFAAGLIVAEKIKKLPEGFKSRDQALAALKKIYAKTDWIYAEQITNGMFQNFSDKLYRFDFSLYIAELYELYGLSEDLTHTVQRIAAPTMFLRAEDGRAVLTRERAERVVTAMPQARMLKIEDTSHSIHWDDPERYLEEVIRFLSPPN